MTEGDKRLERTISMVILALLLIGCLVVLWPFVSALLWAVVLTFSTWPLYERVLRLLRGKRMWAALLMTLVITAVLLMPFALVGSTLADSAKDLANVTRQWMESGPPEPPGWVARVPLVGTQISGYWTSVAGDSKRLLKDLQRFIEPAFAGVLSAGLLVTRGLFELALSILIAFFLYRDGVDVADRVRAAAERIAGERGHRLLELAGNTVRGVVYGILGTALAQGLLAGIGFLIAGVPGAAMLTLLTFFLSILPMGPPLVWIPATIWLFQKGSIGWGIFMLIWGIGVSSVDNIVKPWLISKGSDMPFILIFLGILGGALAFGFIGVFLGPTLLAVCYRLIQEWASVSRSAAAAAPGP